MGSRDPSDMDILKLNQLYACGSEPSASPPSTLPPDEHPHNRTRLAFPSNAAGTATDAEMQEKLKICLNQATCSRRNRCCADMCHKNKQYLGEFKCSSLLGAIREFSCSCTSDRHANLD